MKNSLLAFLFFTSISIGTNAQNVGIGTTTPGYKLQVNGPIAVHNETDAKSWVLDYSSIGDNFRILEGIAVRMVFANGGNVGIGTLSPLAKLHLANGDLQLTDGMIQLDAAGVNKGFIQLSGNDLRVGTNASNTTGNFVVRTNGADRLKVAPDGDVTVNGKGIVYNAANANNLRIYTVQATFPVTLAAHASTTSHIGFTGFSGTPIAYVANIVTNGGASGELFRCILQLYNVTATGCDCKIINTDNAALDQSITWNVVCIGN